MPQAAPATGPEWTEYRPALHRFLLQRLQNSQDAQDLAQEAYLRFYQLDNTHAIQRPSGYLYRIAVNLLYEFRLRQSRDKVTYDSELVDTLSDLTADPSLTDLPERLAAAQQLHRVLQSIPLAYRKILILHRRDGQSVQQIAAALGLSTRTVETYLAKALAYARHARGEP